jgi:hypothetical protein
MQLTPKQLPHPWTPSNPEGMAWYVPAWRAGYYLHRDGVVRQRILHGGERLGYYATEAEALAVIAKFQSANQSEESK